ncbi:hypothetical protein D3C81_1078630 [compost metagenome]
MHDRRPGPRADAVDQREHGQAAGVLRRGAVLHPRPTDHRHRAGLRPHHLGHWCGDDRLVRLRHALLRHAEGAPGPAEQGRRQDRHHHLQDRRACRRPCQGPPGRANSRQCVVQGALRVPLGRPVQPGPGPGHCPCLPRRDPAEGIGQGRALLLDVRAEVLLDEDHPGSA